MSTLTALLLVPLFGVVAAAYASVGLGGGTAYLAVLSAFDSDPASLRPVAWTLNCVVSAIGFVHYQRQGHFSFGHAWPFLLGGLVGAACGSTLPIGATTFQVLLTLTLGAVGIRMLTAKPSKVAEEARPSPHWRLAALALGLVIGVVSGVVGIGGGIILGPIVLALGWLEVKRTAAITSLYIFVSSLGALGAHLASQGTAPFARIGVLAVGVTVGGAIGSRWGAGKASPKVLRQIFGTVALLSAINLAIRIVQAG
jgi:uncharacterized membrane protein YfcA